MRTKEKTLYPINVVLSASINNSTLQKLSGALAKAGIEVWREYDFPAGSLLIDLVARRIQQSDYFLVALSGGVLRRQWMNFEVTLASAQEATQKKSKIILLTLDGIDPKSEFLRGRQVIDLSGDFQKGIEQLFEIILKRDQELLAEFNIDRRHGDWSILQITKEVDAKLIEMFSNNPQLMYKLPPRRFEEMVAELFHGFGFDVELTSRTHDGGRDIIAVRNEAARVRFLIECKRYGPERTVSVSAVRALYGVKMHERATKGILATTASFSRNALLFFEDHKWELEPRDHKGLLEWIQLYEKVQRNKQG